MRNMSLFDASGYLLMGCGAMHLGAFVLGGFSYGIAGLVPAGLLFIALGFAIHRTQWRWLGHVAFLALGLGASFVLREIYISTTAPSWWYGLMLAIQVIAIASLFLALWRNPKAKSA